MLIREYDADRDLSALSDCLIELQDFERSLDPRMPNGAAIIGEYIPRMVGRCKKYNGEIFVAELDSEVVGYTCILTHVVSNEPDDGPKSYALISDLVVLKKHRGQGIGTILMDRAEEFARAKGATCLRINVLAVNDTARSLYEAKGFKEFEVTLEKPLG